LSVNWALPFGEQVPADGWETVSPKKYANSLASTLARGPEFWASVASELDWYRKWDKPLDDSNPPFYKWFVGGELNASQLCVDRHAMGPLRDKTAILWEGEPVDGAAPREVRKVTYGELYREVNRFAYLFKHRYGIKRGDTIGFYMPMVPEFPAAMLAATRLGAPFTVIFSGFSDDALAERLLDADAKLLVTADGGWRRGNVIKLKEIADQALAKAPGIEHSLVLRRVGNPIEMKQGRDDYLDAALGDVARNASVDPVWVRSEDPLFILHTSGTTGKPKGQVHDLGGYMTLLHATMKWVFDISKHDTYWCTADIGWVTGHSYVVFGPLMEGATTVMYEGAIDFPQPDRWVSLIERHRVSVLYTSPTAIRGFMKMGEEWVKKHEVSSIRLMHSVGEPINPAAFRWMHKMIGREKVPFGSTWWMTETGGIMISITPGGEMIPMKPGTNGLPIPGIEADVVDETGKPSAALARGFLVIKRPWPGMPLTIHKDPERYRQVYWSRFPGWFYAGDYAVRDNDGYFWILGRADEVIKVAGHRLGTYELESALVHHSAVAEAAVVAVPDSVKGEVPVAFVILRAGSTPTDGLREELKARVREHVGHIATLKEVYFVPKLPKTRSAKIMRRVVRAVVQGTPVGDVSTLEDEASVDEIKRAYDELKEEISK
jgi:acetyl-CoA synthetase